MKVLKPTIPKQLATPTDVRKLFTLHDDIRELSVVGATLDAVSNKSLHISESEFVKTDLSRMVIERFDALDCIFRQCNLSASKFVDSSWHVISFDGIRASGMQLQHSRLKNILFKDSKLEMTNFRSTHMENIIFEDCNLDEVDFNGARLKNIDFINCTIKNISFAGTKIVSVNLSQSHIESIKGVASLKGITISYDQLMQLAPYFAHEAGIKVV